MLVKTAERMNGVQKSIIRQIFEAAQGNSINLGLGEIQYDTPALIKEFASFVAMEENCRYTFNAGTKELRDKIADYYNGKVKPEGVCVTCGAAEALHSCFTAYVDEGDEVMIADPTFLAYEASIRMNQGKVVTYSLDPENNFSLDKEDFLSKLSEKTKIVMLCNPSNPLSKALTLEEMQFIIDQCRPRNIMIIADEIYRELTYIDRQPSMLDLYENTIVISGISKSHCMTGWRIGWAASPITDYIKPVVVAHQYQSTCAPYISQRAAELAMSPEGLETIKEIMDQLTSAKEKLFAFMRKELPHVNYLEPDAAPYLFIKVGGDDTEFAKKAAEQGVIVIPGSAFGNSGKGWIRISYALDGYILLEGMKKLKNIL